MFLLKQIEILVKPEMPIHVQLHGDKIQWTQLELFGQHKHKKRL